MERYLKKINDNLYGFLLWDESWKSYNNCYIVIEKNDVILIDSGKEEHFEFLETAMNSIGIDKRDISKFIATHGHKDHIGGIKFLENVDGFIHKNDIDLLPEEIINKLKPNLPNKGFTVNNLECDLLGHHTKGSVSLYHNESKALFCGDHICFFGEPLNDNNVLEEGKVNREKFKKFVADWSQNEEMKKQYNFDLFIEGLKTIKNYDAEYLCTGQGLILKGNIGEFINDLLEYE